MRKLLLLEDDAFFAQSISDEVGELGFSCTTFSSVKEIETRLRRKAPDALVTDLAIPLGGSKLFTNITTHGGAQAGKAVLRFARRRWPKIPTALITGHPTSEVKDWCNANGIDYFIKPIDRSTLERFLGMRKMRVFIVHGHNKKSLRTLKSALKNMRIEPVVLMECANHGKTVIEKFEEVADSCDCAIVAASPDDVGRLASAPSEAAQYRTRQNVLFELGYFYGALGRRSGSVVFVEYGDTEIPSDLAGVVRIDGRVSASNLKKTLAAEFAAISR